MKKFGEGQQPFHAIIDIPEGDSQELTTVTDQALNSLYGELFNLLQTHGINPTATTNADLKQVARAVWAAVNAGNMFIDSGTANIKKLTHFKGKDFLYRQGNSGDNGFIIEFLNTVENTGSVIINVFDVEKNENHFNAVHLVDVNGEQLQAKALPVNSMIKAIYDYAKNSFVISSIYNARTNDSLVYNLENEPLRKVGINVVESVANLANLSKVNGRTVYVKSYHAGLGIGGGVFVYDESKANLNDGMVNFGGWVRQYERLNITMAGAKGNGSDDAQSLKIATALSVQLKKSLYIDVDISISSGVDLRATMRIIGDGGALQGSRKIICLNDTAAFYVIGGFSSESSVFENLQFCAKTGGTGAGFGQRADGYLSQTSFKNCTFDRSLRYGIDANIILCDFYKCDFGSYAIADNQVGYKAIRSIGNSGYEPNANLFMQCIFRNGNDNYMIEYLAYGTQWQFINCDFEQNKCTDSVIYAEAAGGILFNGGYAEANKTPYFIKTGGNQMSGFSNCIIFQSVLFNDPAQRAIGKNLNPNYARYDFQACYGRLLCAMYEGSDGVFNDLSLLSRATDCNFVMGNGGDVGLINTLVNTNGYNAFEFKTYKKQAYGNTKRAAYTFTTEQAKPVAKLENIINPAYSFGGIVNIFVGAGVREGDTNAASYSLLVSLGGIADAKLIGKSGLTDGTAANHPSFTFTLDGNKNIIATAVGQTSGTFLFNISTGGDIKII